MAHKASCAAARGALGGEYHGEREARQEIEGGSRRTAAAAPAAAAAAVAPRATASTSIDLLIAGSQTGADRASLEAARAAGIATAGVAPQGWKTERGTEQAVLEALGLQEGSGGYAAADKANVKQCDAVLAFRFRVPKTGRGAEKTVHCARTAGTYEHVELAWPPAAVVSEALEPLAPGGRPVLVVWDLSSENAPRAAAELVAFLKRLVAKRLMVTGARRVDAGDAAAGEHIGAMLAMAFAQMK